MRHHLFFLSLCLLLASSSCLLSQTSQGSHAPIVQIRFEGMKRTDPAWLLRFIQSPIGSPPDSQRIARDCQRLRNLPFLADASFRIDSSKAGLELVFELMESWTRFPIVNFGGIRGNIWAQLGLNDIHWRGRGIQFTGMYQLTDGRHGGQALPQNPLPQGESVGHLLQWPELGLYRAALF
jgi:hypothetical protein